MRPIIPILLAEGRGKGSGHFHENHILNNFQILLLTVSSGWAILLIGSLIENNFPALGFLVFLILFLFYLFIRIYNNSEKKVKRY